MQVLIALLRDGFNPESQGGNVRLRDDGTPQLDYPLLPLLWDGARRALRSMAEIQFAAGAKLVMPVHAEGAAFVIATHDQRLTRRCDRIVALLDGRITETATALMETAP